MQNAKRMVLIDEKLLDYSPILQHYRTKQELQPTELTVKSALSKQMESTIDDPTIPDDVKAKHYGQNLQRFLQTKRKLDEPDLDTTANEQLEAPVKKIGKKTPYKKRASRRIKKKHKRYADIEWEPW